MELEYSGSHYIFMDYYKGEDYPYCAGGLTLRNDERINGCRDFLGNNAKTYERRWDFECVLAYPREEIFGEIYQAMQTDTCPGDAPVCYQGECECDNANGAEAGFYSGEEMRIKDIVPGSVKIGFDETFAADAKQNRGFTPSGDITPFDDFYIEVKVKLCPRAGVAAPSSIPFPPSIVTQGIKVVDGEGLFYKVDETSTEATYRWNLRGWSNSKIGIAIGIVEVNGQFLNKQEILVDSITNNKPITLFINDPINEESFERDISFGSCVQLAGNGEHEIVYMRGKSSTPNSIPFALVLQGEQVRTSGYETIDPFKTYKTSFSHYVDLANHDDTGWSLHDFFKKKFNTPARISTCNEKIGREATLYYFYQNFMTGSASLIGGKVTYLASGDPITAIHETGHSFCKLGDEYILHSPRKPSGSFGRNCVAANFLPFAYQKDDTLYGELNHIGCTDYFKGNSENPIYYHRPSDKSIMNDFEDQGVNLFNTISCGYCMEAINGGNAQTHWAKCNILNTVKPNTP